MRKWYLIMTKHHKDACAEEQLSRQQYTVYRPLIKKEKKVKNKVIKIKESLFPRYLFIQLDMGVDDFSRVRSTKGVLNIVRFGNSFTEVPDEIIRLLRKGEIINKKSSKDLRCFKSGDKIIIKEGPFLGLEALFDRYKQGGDRVIVLFNMLNKMTSLDLSINEVKSIA